MNINEIYRILTPRLINLIDGLDADFIENIREIILFKNKPVILSTGNNNFYLSKCSSVVKKFDESSFIMSENEFNDIFINICERSVYSHQNDIIKGYITIKGGHRVGIAGSAVYTNNKLININNISALNIRLARQVIGCAQPLKNILINSRKNILIFGPPSSGKTTVIRDIARLLSKSLVKVVIIDERCEIGACFDGDSSNDLGHTVFILDGFLKTDGIEHAIRSLSPDTLICDEIGNEHDWTAITRAYNSGCRIIATAHIENPDELYLKDYIKNQKFFSYGVLLSQIEPSKILKILDLSEI